MPVLTVRGNDRFRQIPFRTGQSLREILDSTNIRVRAGCSGSGACGLCRVRIESATVPRPTEKECAILNRSLLENRVRLACQVRPKKNIRIKILNPARKSNWRTLTADPGLQRRQQQFPLRQLSPDPLARYGVAVDLGTTHISIAVHDLRTGRLLGGRIGRNPQADTGADIMTRLVAASGSPVQADRLARDVRGAIGEALQDIAVRDGINLSRVTRFALVGNTAMLALLSGRNYQHLTKPAYWTEYIDCAPEDAGSWAAGWGLDPGAVIDIIPPLAGFVGSDFLAGILATHLVRSGRPGLFIDFGTNSEIAFWDGSVLRVTSAAGGPAFEGSGFSCGMAAEPGAVSRVRFRNNAAVLEVIAGIEARGLCGSGIVDLIAGLIRRGILTREGRLVRDYTATGFPVTDRDPKIILSRGDIDLFQRAKAAIASGIRILLDEAGMDYPDIQNICIGGIFGHFLDRNNARKTGLLPMVPVNRIHLCGNTALRGCELALLSSKAADQLNTLRDTAHTINMSQCSSFDDIFMENLYLRPLKGRVS